MGSTVAHRVEYILFRGLEAVVAGVAWRRRVALGQKIGRLWHLLDAGRRRVARENAARAFPDWPKERVAAMVRANFEHLGATGAEFLGLSTASVGDLLDRYRFEGLEHYEEAKSRGKGVLCLTAHLGNWEFVSAVMAARGQPLAAVARRIANPWVERRITSLRERFGAQLIRHRNAARPVLQALKRGGSVAFLMDHKPLAREAVPSRFFGQTVATNQGLALLALKSEAPVVPGFDERTGEQHVLRVEPALEAPRGGTREERVRRYTEAFDATIERAVRRRPEQWFWVHRRFRLPKEWKT